MILTLKLTFLLLGDIWTPSSMYEIINSQRSHPNKGVEEMSKAPVKLGTREWAIFTILALLLPFTIAAASDGTWIFFFNFFTLELTPTPAILWPSGMTFLILFNSYLVVHVLRNPEDANFGDQKQWLTVLVLFWLVTPFVYSLAYIEFPLTLVPLPHVPLYGIIILIHRPNREQNEKN